MSDTRRQDPLRRTPPTINLKAEVVPPKDGKPAGQPTEGAGAAPKGAAPGEAKPGATTPTGQPAKAPEPAKPLDTPKPAAGPAASASSPAAKPGETPKPQDKPATDAKPTTDAKPATTAAAPAQPAKPAEPTKPGQGSIVPAGTKPAEPAKTPEAAKIATAAAKAEPAKSEPGKQEPAKPAVAKSEPAKTEPTKPSSQASASAARQPSPAAPQERYGTASVATAGLVGGVIGAAIATALNLFVLRENGDAERLAALERRVAALPSGQAGPSETRIAALETGLKQVTDEARTAGKQAAEALARPIGSGADQEARTGIQTLTTTVRDGAAKTASSLGDLGQKLDAQGRNLTTQGQKLDTQTQKLEALDKSAAERLAVLGKDVETYGVHQRSLQADVALLRTGTAALDTRTADADKRMAGLTDSVNKISADLSNLSPATIKAGLRMVISGRLDDALRNGAPLGPALSALDKLGTDAQALAPLRTFADLPAPSAAALLAEFRPLGLAMTTVPPPPGETYWDKGRRLLGKAVTVQTVGDGTGQDVPGLVARIENSLSRGAVGEAKAAWDRLPQDKRAAGTNWGAKLTARAAADEAARRISAQSLSVLDSSTR